MCLHWCFFAHDNISSIAWIVIIIFHAIWHEWRLWVELVPQRLAMYWKKKKIALFLTSWRCARISLHTFSKSSKGFWSEDERREIVANRKEFIRWWKSIETCENERNSLVAKKNFQMHISLTFLSSFYHSLSMNVCDGENGKWHKITFFLFCSLDI